MWPENLSLAGRGLCLRAAGKHVPAGRFRCQSAMLMPSTQRNERTRAHVLICVLSLMVLRLMQIELARAGSYMTVDSITSALNNARLLPLRTESGTILVNCEENEGIYTDDPSEDKELSATERYLKVREENPDSTDLIMKTMGLSPLGPFNSVDKTKLALKIAQSNNSILGDAIDAITKRIAAA